MRQYLNSLSFDQREDFATRCETTVGYLWQIAGGHRVPSRTLAEAFERESNGLLSKEALIFPDSNQKQKYGT